MNFYVNGFSLGYGKKNLPEFLAELLPGSPPECHGPTADLKKLLPGLNLRRISSCGRLALQVACQALLDGLPDVSLPLPDKRAPGIGLYIGSALGAVENSFSFMDSILDSGAQLASPTHFSHSVNNVYCGLLSLSLNIQGPSCTVCQFWMSFAGACQAALSALGSGEVEYALLGAVEQASASMDLVKTSSSLTKNGAAAEQDCAVFFLLSTHPEGPVISLPHWLENPAAESSGHSALTAHWQRFYAGHPAEQGLDLAAALALSYKTFSCRSARPVSGLGAEITVSFTER